MQAAKIKKQGKERQSGQASLLMPVPEPKLLPPWPLTRRPRWAARVYECITKEEPHAVRLSPQQGKPFGNEAWVESMARRINPESTIRPRRPTASSFYGV